MTSDASLVRTGTERPTIWGLTPSQLHDRFWAARGVQVVRPGEQIEVVKGAELFLLMASDLLTVFRLRKLVDQLSWLRPDVMWVRLRHERERDYREVTAVGDEGEFAGFQRLYGGSDARLARVALTPDREVARRWQSLASDAVAGWRELRRLIPRERRASAGIKARTYDRRSDHEAVAFVRDLIQTWQYPAATVGRARKVAAHVWGDVDAQVTKGTSFVGPVWIGAGRSPARHETVVGPAVLWDDPAARPGTQRVEWDELEPSQTFGRPVRPRLRKSPYVVGKRIFDLIFASIALLVLSPFLPIIMLAIYLEDGRPFFFGHLRESRGGRPFLCLKFRSMCNNADRLKGNLGSKNQVDGPQFYIEEDPRVTRVGRFLRRFYLDELPQLINVLAGDMSIVGPRPSPYKENQYCPPWREARLSVLPGITGLWQVMRTRQQGRDFQEWIKYDIEYVENISLLLDLRILWKTLWYCIRG